MKIEEAQKNIDIVISNARITRQEHIVLQESLLTLVNCIKSLEEDKKEEDRNA